MPGFCLLQLACADKAEASKIASALLNKRLVTCAKQLPVASSYVWQGKIEHSEEVLLVMESREDLFDQIEKEIATIHSYDTFVLTAIKLTKVSKRAKNWLNESLNNG